MASAILGSLPNVLIQAYDASREDLQAKAVPGLWVYTAEAEAIVDIARAGVNGFFGPHFRTQRFEPAPDAPVVQLSMQYGILMLVPSPLGVGWCVCMYRIAGNYPIQVWLTHGGKLVVFHKMGEAMNAALVHSVDGTPAKVLPLVGGITDGMYWCPVAPFAVAGSFEPVPAETPDEGKPKAAWKRSKAA